MRIFSIILICLIQALSSFADEFASSTNTLSEATIPSKAKKTTTPKSKASASKKNSKPVPRSSSASNPSKRVLLPSVDQAERPLVLVATPASPLMDLPTDNELLFSKTHSKNFFQPTFSGRTLSAMFGCVRSLNSNGKFTRFHEGVDIRPLEYKGNGEPSDLVHSVGEGVIAYVCPDSDDSNYGKYIVIEHNFFGCPFFSLYAHLSSINDDIEPGVKVEKGQKIGILGRTSNEFHIHQDFAHLHFEVNLMVNDRYVEWSNAVGDGTPKHGKFNGANLIGIDPVRFYQFLQINPDAGLSDFISRERVAFRVVVPFKKNFSWIQHYPFSLTKSVSDATTALEISMTYYGLPIRIEPKEKGELDARLIKALSLGIYPLTYANAVDLRANESCLNQLSRKDKYWGLNSKGKAWLDQLLY
jgi:peptidoglycan LD-endopeptidase LytH